MDLVLPRSFMSYCILFRGPSIVSRAFLAFLKTCGFDPFSPFYKLLHTVLGSVDSFEGISGSHENSWIWSFLVVLLATAYCFGSVDSFEVISGIPENSWNWSFLALVCASAYCFGVRRQFGGHFSYS